MTKAERVDILMVDEEPSRLDEYEQALSPLGENLLKAKTTGEALSALKSSNVAVVLIDDLTANANGFELANIIRQSPGHEQTPIMYISNTGAANPDKHRTGDIPPTELGQLPAQPETLREKVSALVDIHRKSHPAESARTIAEREDLLARNEAEFRMRARLLDIATEAIIVRDLAGSIKFWNAGAEKTYGWTRDEAIGHKIHELLQTTFPVPFAQIESDLRENRSWQGRLTQSKKNGERIVLDCRKTMNDENDAVLEVNRDITTEIKAEEALRVTEKLAAMGRVAGIIAHEINNPLAAITNIFFLLRNHPSLTEDTRSLLERAEQELERVSHITRQTLSFYREAKKPILVFIPELLDDVLELQYRLLRESKVTVRRKYQSAGPVTGFPAELRQVLLNLVGNAIQAMARGGVLGVCVREATDWRKKSRGIMVSIIDTGVGIPKDDTQQIFQPFYSTKSTKGTGLGLWISRGIVQKYDGRISFRTLRSKNGNVTCFRVFLPGIGASDPGLKPGSDEEQQEHPVSTTS